MIKSLYITFALAHALTFALSQPTATRPIPNQIIVQDADYANIVPFVPSATILQGIPTFDGMVATGQAMIVYEVDPTIDYTVTAYAAPDGQTAGESPESISIQLNATRHIDRSWLDQVTREPMWLIHAANGVRGLNYYPEDDHLGTYRWWRGPDAVPNFVEKIREGYAHDARWFLINRPMGTDDTAWVPGASWLTLSDYKRDQLPAQLMDALLDEFDEPVHVVWFVGSKMKDPRTLKGWHPAESDQYYNIGDTSSWKGLLSSRTTLGGWISTGSSGFVFDASSHPRDREHFLQLAHQLRQSPFNQFVGGEAFPRVASETDQPVLDDNGRYVLDVHAMESMPWMGFSQYIRHESRWPYGTKTDTWPPDPETTRMYQVFELANSVYGSDHHKQGLIQQSIREHLIPVTKDPVMFDHAMMIYQMIEEARQ